MIGVIQTVDSFRQRRVTSALFVVSLMMLLFGAAAGQPEGTAVSATPVRLSTSFADVANRVQPAVVNIDTKGKMPEVTLRGDGEGRSKDLEEFIRQNVPPRPVYAVGSGFIVDPGGYILTNYHVVRDASRIRIKLQNGDEFDATIVGADEETDIAVLKIDAGKPLPYLEFGDSEKARIGDWVLAVGSPFGLARTVTAGIISQTNRETAPGNPFQRFLQTDAAINRGNSGGPLVDLNGAVIGVNSQIATSTGDYNGIGFALPSNEAENVYRQILSFGKVKRGYLGVFLESVGKEFAEVYGMGSTRGAIITSIRETEGAAATAGLRNNDIITSVDGKPVANAQELIARVASTQPGKEIEIAYLREAGEKVNPGVVRVTLDERPGSAPAGDLDTPKKLPIEEIKETKPFGLTVDFVDGKTSKDSKYKDKKGVLVRRIDPSSFINEETTSVGVPVLMAGDLIERINRKSITDLASFKKAVESLKEGDAVVLHLSRYFADTNQALPQVVQFTVKSER